MMEPFSSHALVWGGGRSFLADFAFCAPDLAGAHRRLTKVGQRVAMIVKVSCYIGQTLSNYLTFEYRPQGLTLR